MLTALLPLAALFLPPPPSAPAQAAQAFADAERVVAVHTIPGAVVFDLDRAGDLFQLTISLDDDGAVIATALDWTGPATADGGVAPGAAALLDRIEHIDTSADGRTVVLRDRDASAGFAIAGA